jgi:hypothetical protein
MIQLHQLPRQQSEAAKLKSWMLQPEAQMLRESALAKASEHVINAANHLMKVSEDKTHMDEVVAENATARKYADFISVFDEILNEHPYILEIKPAASVVKISEVNSEQ